MMSTLDASPNSRPATLPPTTHPTPQTIASESFAPAIESRTLSARPDAQRLKLLTILTTADIRAVGPGSGMAGKRS
jgi:hypothetical protein